MTHPHHHHDDPHAHHKAHEPASVRHEPAPHVDHGNHGAAGHDRHAGHSVAMFRERFWGSVALTIPTIIWSPMVQMWLGFSAPQFPGSRYVPAMFGTVLFFYAGLIFLKGAAQELRDRLPGMMTLISLAISVAFLFSIAVTLGVSGMDLWWELATLITIMVLGHWIEMRSISQAEGALKELAKLVPDMAERVLGDRSETVPVADLREGDIVLVRPGASVPADGVVVQGSSSVNESMITGESRPVDKRENDNVIAGTVNGSGSLRARVTKTGDNTALAGIMRLVADAQSSRSRAQALADRAAFFLTIVAIVSAAITLIAWLISGAAPAFAIERVVTVLVIACPHALGLAIPLVIAISTTIGARSGLLVRDRRGLEEAKDLDTVFFDKTGTLTRGEFRVVGVSTGGDMSGDEALLLAAALEHDSEHSIAQGIVKSAQERELDIPAVQNFKALPGEGVEGTVNGRHLMIGGPSLLRRLGIDPDPQLEQAAELASSKGQTVVTLIEGTKPLAIFAIADAIREESYDAVKKLHSQNVEVVMMTGDAKPVADAVAAELGIDQVLAGVLPSEKSSKIEDAKRSGKRVAMVGDGVNDAPALLASDVGIAIGAGTDVAVEAGDVVLIRSDPRDVWRIIRLSKATYRKMIQNLWWAAGYNIFALPLAAGILAPWGIVLNPAVGAVLMSLSTIVVALNAQLLRRVRL